MRTVQLLIFIIVSMLLFGCGNFNSIHRDLNVSDGNGALIDIKQRAIIVKHTGADTIVCAEPSPDALSAYAAELAAEADLPETVTARLAAAVQESASYVGLRTQSIQLLRDALYRLCEGYMNGSLDKGEYDILMRRYQKYMVALLAIEQLTGSLRSPAIAINTGGSAQAARSISEMRSEVVTIDKQIDILETKKKEDGIKEEEKKQLDSKINSLQDDKKAIEEGIKSAQGITAKGSTNVIVSSVGVPTQRADAHLQAVSKVVSQIVLEILNTDDTGQLCFSYLSETSRTRKATGSGTTANSGGNLTAQKTGEEDVLKDECVKYISNINETNALKIRQAKLILDQAEKEGKISEKNKEAVNHIIDTIDPGFKIYTFDFTLKQ